MLCEKEFELKNLNLFCSDKCQKKYHKTAFESHEKIDPYYLASARILHEKTVNEFFRLCEESGDEDILDKLIEIKIKVLELQQLVKK